VQFAPAAGRTPFGVGDDHPTVLRLFQRLGRAKLDAQPAPLAPIGKNCWASLSLGFFHPVLAHSRLSKLQIAIRKLQFALYHTYTCLKIATLLSFLRV
jgi:hypothetical protein